jgi:hypothetical protein
MLSWAMPIKPVIRQGQLEHTTKYKQVIVMININYRVIQRFEFSIIFAMEESHLFSLTTSVVSVLSETKFASQVRRVDSTTLEIANQQWTGNHSLGCDSFRDQQSANRARLRLGPVEEFLSIAHSVLNSVSGAPRARLSLFTSFVEYGLSCHLISCGLAINKSNVRMSTVW